MFFKRNNHGNKAKKLPRQVHEFMRSRFILLPEYLETLRCFEYDGIFKGRQSKCIRIFSPYQVKERQLSIRSQRDLEQHPEILLFEGHLDGKGNTYVADRRPPLRPNKAA